MAHTLVTGASSGIGRSIAERLSCGQSLILSGRDVKRLEETAETLSASKSHLVWPFDLTKTDTVFDAVGDFIASNGVEITGFVHAAGLCEFGAIRISKPDAVIRQFRVNTFSAMEILRALASKKHNARNLSNVVVISSIAAKKGTPGMAAYAASKAALLGWMRAVAIELAPQVRVNAVLPGGIRTPGTEMFYASATEVDRIAASYPLGAGCVDDVANMVVFLMSEDARWITGQEFVVDGGISIL